MSNKIYAYVNYRSMYFNTSVFLFFSLFLAFTEFFPFLSKVFILPLPLIILLFSYVVFNKPYIKRHIIYFCFLFLGLVLVLFLRKTSFNGLMLSPILSYMTFVIFRDLIQDKYIEINFDVFLKCIVVFLLFFSVLEVLIKLNILVFDFYKDFILNYGDGRLDVLRTRVLWGSSLSSAAVGIFLTFYFSLIRKNLAFIGLVFFYIALTGSRTAIVLFVIMVVAMLIKKRSLWQLKCSKRNFSTIIFSIPIFIFIFICLLNSSVGEIITRSFTIKADLSFTGREGTTGVVLDRLLSSLPDSLFWGLANDDWVSDSAFTSIAAHSGVLLLFLFVGYIFILLFNTRLDLITKFTFIFVTILGGSIIGDYFIPVVSFLYTLTFLIYEKNSTCNYWTK